MGKTKYDVPQHVPRRLHQWTEQAIATYLTTRGVYYYPMYNQMPDTPYKGLMPFFEKDAPFFFGREKWREIITDNLMASRLTLLYGASGVGKSSVLQAGVAYRLRQRAKQNQKDYGTPKYAVVVFRSWRDDPLEGLMKQVTAEIECLFDDQKLASVPPSRQLDQFLSAWTEGIGSKRRKGRLFVILDQFEDYLLYHSKEKGEGTFAVEFPRAINRPDLPVNFLISIREESLAKLDRFKEGIPSLFDNYLRIEHLDKNSAQDAIVKPVEEYNRKRSLGEKSISVEPALVEEVLKQIVASQEEAIWVVFLLATAKLYRFLSILLRNDSKSKTLPQIEAPYLQLVMTRLWQEEMKENSHCLRLETLTTKLGGVKNIVQQHVNEKMSSLPRNERDIAARAFKYLVTPLGAKMPYSVPDLAAYVKVEPKKFRGLLEKLARGDFRLLAPVGPTSDKPDLQRYEIFHEILAPAILGWREEYVNKRRVLVEGLVGVVITVVCLIVLPNFGKVVIMPEVTKALSDFDELQKEYIKYLDDLKSNQPRNNENLQRNKEYLQKFVNVGDELQKFSKWSWWWKIAGWESPYTEQQYRLMRILASMLSQSEKALLSGEEIYVGDGKTPILGVSFSPDGKQLAAGSADGNLRLWNVQDKPITEITEPELLLSIGKTPILSVSFSPDGKHSLLAQKMAHFACGMYRISR
ncbi:MAG: hypothetical protein QNJ70_06465 [Xenococcaceae cyanobacterium MO_207.B15]|nr:hypothetical protein [Xenococcaceae cyanobacterium MO_207.B15]